MFKKDQKGIIDPLFIVAMVLVVGVGAFLFWRVNQTKEEKQANTPVITQDQEQEQPTETEEPPEELPILEAGTFSFPANEGSFQARGFVTIAQLTKAGCRASECSDWPKIDVAFFNIVETKNTDIQKYIDDLQGNTLVNEKGFSIGCSKDGIINYNNMSDEKGSYDYKFSESDSKLLLESNENSLVTIEADKLMFSGGREAPDCYSHFTTFTLLGT